jgi:hypothetical protein
MDTLERAGLALVEKSVRPPTPLSVLEARARQLRRRQRTLRAAAGSAVLVVLIGAGLALAGPPEDSSPLDVVGPSPVDPTEATGPATAIPLEATLAVSDVSVNTGRTDALHIVGERLRAIGYTDVVVRDDGETVHVESTGSGDRWPTDLEALTRTGYLSLDTWQTQSDTNCDGTTVQCPAPPLVWTATASYPLPQPSGIVMFTRLDGSRVLGVVGRDAADLPFDVREVLEACTAAEDGCTNQGVVLRTDGADVGQVALDPLDEDPPGIEVIVVPAAGDVDILATRALHAFARTGPLPAGITFSVLAAGPAQAPVSSVTPTVTTSTSLQADSGWTTVGADTPSGVGSVRTEVLQPSDEGDRLRPGDAVRVYDSTGDVVGYWVMPLGFVAAAPIEAGAYDWVTAMEATEPGRQAMSELFPEGLPADQSRLVTVRDR